MATIHDLRSAAKRLGCTIEVDDDCQCYRATAPNGFAFENGLHELIEVFGGGILGNGGTKRQARDELTARLNRYVDLVEVRGVSRSQPATAKSVRSTFNF